MDLKLLISSEMLIMLLSKDIELFTNTNVVHGVASMSLSKDNL